MKEYASDIFKNMDYNQMNANLLNLVKITLEKNSSEYSFEAKNIINNALSIWAGSLINKPELLESTKKF
jgi:hypothetical protein